MPKSDTWWKPGQSGNPAGRPKGKTLSELLRQALDWPDTRGETNGEKVVDRLLRVAIAGNVEALRYVFDRVDGKPIEQVVTSGDKDINITITRMRAEPESGGSSEAG